MIVLIWGSSPLTRGKLGELVHFLRGHRLIPAHAGKTRPRASSPACTGAHPRSRGENPCAARACAPSAGSSPLTRGKLGAVIGWPRKVGLIPAHAGKTCIAGNAVLTVGAHPRSRGENGRLHGLDEEGAGSSPLTRGKPRRASPTASCTGLIPAHAGKTTTPAANPASSTAHPRSRGENIISESVQLGSKGSSPLTRGKRDNLGRQFDRPGLIPAHAGKTATIARLRARSRAHPRSRGENFRTWSESVRYWGSSPLTRGKP